MHNSVKNIIVFFVRFVKRKIAAPSIFILFFKLLLDIPLFKRQSTYIHCLYIDWKLAL